MFNNNETALLMMDHPHRDKIEEYLEKRYNLNTEAVPGLIEVYDRIGDSESEYELVILDEKTVDLPTTSHALKTIKDQCTDTDVLYLSNLTELQDAMEGKDTDISEDFSDPDFRDHLADVRLDCRLAMQFPIMEAATLEDVYRIVCDGLLTSFQPDHVLCAVLRLDEKPLVHGVAVNILDLDKTAPTDDVPEDEEEEEDIVPDPSLMEDVPHYRGKRNPRSYEFEIKDSVHMTNMIQYFKPIHIPHLETEPEFRDELEEKFKQRYRSALMLPMQINGNTIGFLGMFAREKPRVFNLVEIDLTQRLADMAAVAIFTIFLRNEEPEKFNSLMKRTKDEDNPGVAT
ncbi:MAG: GAF domain-containing protein [bacterium]|nr:GAF domain-containing protein [bacterium]